MERKVVIICVLVGFLGFLAAALGFAAEAKRIKVSDVQLTSSGTCFYPRTPALVLAFTAAFALLTAHLIINTAAGCICCNRHTNSSNTNWTVALVSFVVSWVTFIIAFLLLLIGAALNDQHGEEQRYWGNYCFVVKAGVFSGGAVLSISSIGLGIGYYLTLTKNKNLADPWHGRLRQQPGNNDGISLGRPQIPPQSAQQQQPVFLPEDTYGRQQFP